jgi:hypothetical protein
MTRNTEAGAANTCECGHDFYTHTNNTGKCGAGSCRCQKFSPRPDAAPATEGELEWLRPLYDYVMRYDADNMSDRAGVALNELHRRLAKPSSTQPPATEGDARNSSTSISTPKTAVTSDSSSKSATSWEFMHEQPPAPAGEEIEAIYTAAGLKYTPGSVGMDISNIANAFYSSTPSESEKSAFNRLASAARQASALQARVAELEKALREQSHSNP